MANFIFGFHAAAQVLAIVVGGLSALLLFALAAVLIFGIAGAIFDWVTRSIAVSWIRNGKHPGGKLARILLKYHGDIQS